MIDKGLIFHCGDNVLEQNFAIKVYKQYFNFACAHFLVFADGSREPLHGHNYKVSVEGKNNTLVSDMVFDFLDLKPLVRDLCNQLDHKLLLPAENPLLKIETENLNSSSNTPQALKVTTPDGFVWSFPAKDALILPIPNTSVERIAQYLCFELAQAINQKYKYKFSELTVEVEETPGQCAVFTAKL